MGRHSTNNLNDGYVGSGKWVRSIKNKKLLKKEIIEFCEAPEMLFLLEKEYISVYIKETNCMNFNNSPVGFSSGKLNPNTRPENKEKARQRLLKDNPAKRIEVRKKMSAAQLGKPRKTLGKNLTDEHKRKISLGRTGIKYSKEGRQKLSLSRKADKNRVLPSFIGRNHTEETKKKQSDSAVNRQRLICSYCGKDFKPHTFKRWHGEKCKHKQGYS